MCKYSHLYSLLLLNLSAICKYFSPVCHVNDCLVFYYKNKQTTKQNKTVESPSLTTFWFLGFLDSLFLPFLLSKIHVVIMD